MMHQAKPGIARAAMAVPTGSWAALALLLASYSFSWLDRYIFAILIEPIRLDLHLLDWQIGLLSGLAFTLAYAIAGFPFARWADRGRRNVIIAMALACWSLITVLSGFATGFLGLAAARSGVAICEAGCSPAAHSLISDLFPAQRRAMAFAIYGLGIPLGIWAGLSLGGVISRTYGWRTAFIALGAPGLMLALVVRLTLREPQRGRFDSPGAHKARHYPWREALALLWQRRSFLAVALGLSCLSFNGSGIQLWAPTYLLRASGGDIGSIGLLTGTVNGITGVIGTLLAGFVADRFADRDPRWYVWGTVGSACFIAVSQVLFLFLDGQASYVFFIVTMFGLSTYTAPLFSAGQLLLPPRMRAFGAAVMLFLLNLIGAGGGPVFIGAVSSWLALHGSAEPLRIAMACSIIGLAPAIVCLIYAARRLRQDLHDLKTGSA